MPRYAEFGKKDTVNELIRALETGLGLCAESVCGVL